MALFGALIWPCAIAFLLLQSCSLLVSAKKTYIVRMNKQMKPTSFDTHAAWYSDHLHTFTAATPDSIIYTYDTAYHGFAAALTEDEAESLRQSDAVLGLIEDTVYNLHTTHTPDFLGIGPNVGGQFAGQSLQDINKASQDVIIGVVDTGVWPDSKSFNDEGMTEVPARWRGGCEHAKDFSITNCNNKLIGARFFNKGYIASLGGTKTTELPSPRDGDGHGTHTASTAAGATVQQASLFGYARGAAQGMAVSARLATYKACWKGGCFSSDILAAMESAIDDGVDVLSLSLGGAPSLPYFLDFVAVGAFAAMERGIVVSCSAGNSGPEQGTLTNVAPWIMTVGAGTLDRDFPAFAILDNGKKYKGMSLYSGEGMGNKAVELVYNSSRNSTSSLCLSGSLDPASVSGKVVVCDRGVNARVEKGSVVKAAGGVGMILANTDENGEEIVADSHVLPTVAVGENLGDQIRKYVKTAKYPTALLSFGGTLLGVKPSPMVAAFTSRGPNPVTAEILKPDLIGPGVNILAAWTGAVAPTGLVTDSRRTPFNIISGTSMSCPHISGLAALLKAVHPRWSPSAIKSALMTTAYTVDNTNSPLLDAADNSPATSHAYGSGYVNLTKALDPGLVYDATAEDYVGFLCSLNYKPEDVQLITKNPKDNCTKRLRNAGQLNYPSISVIFRNKKVVSRSRILTNVGKPSVYTASVQGFTNVVVSVEPTKLEFEKVGDKKRYKVSFVSNSSEKTVAFGKIVWKSELYEVSSSVSIAWRSQ